MKYETLLIDLEEQKMLIELEKEEHFNQISLIKNQIRIELELLKRNNSYYKLKNEEEDVIVDKNNEEFKIIKFPCLHQCCFHGKEFDIKFFKELFHKFFYIYILPLSLGSFDGSRNFSNYLVKELLYLNNYQNAGLRIDDCFKLELEYMREEVEILLRKNSFNRSDIIFEQIFRVDRYIVDLLKHEVNFFIHGLLKETNIDKRYFSTDDDQRISNVVIEVTRDQNNEMKIVSNRKTFRTKINVGVAIQGVEKDVFIGFLDSISKANTFDKEHFDGKTKLFVVDNIDNIDNTNKIISNYTNNNLEIEVISLNNSKFVKVQCFQSILEQIDDDDEIALLLDVDIRIPDDFFYRVKVFTKRGKMIYNPVCYSQRKNKELMNDDILINKNEVWHLLQTESNIKYVFEDPEISNEVGLQPNGFWRKYGTGVIAGYKEDFNVVGGYDTLYFADKWGHEDNDILVRFLKLGYIVFHSVEMNYFHSYHSSRSWAL